MTQEEKAKAYDEALEQAKFYHENCPSEPERKKLEKMFPALRESEDERIRRTLVEYFGPKVQLDFVRGVPIQKIRDWLEKQKEQKPEDKEITLTNFEEVLNTFLFDFANSPIEDCEPKEYIKKHSAEILKAAYTELNAQLKQDIFEATQEGRREGYEAAKAEQKPAEWSEEDEKMLELVIANYEYMFDKLRKGDDSDGIPDHILIMDWLKSLRPSWKPSQEQMKALEVAFRKDGDDNYRNAINSLYNDLKRL